MHDYYPNTIDFKRSRTPLKSFVISVLVGAFAASSCGPLPRPKSFSATLPKLSISEDVSGLALISTDTNYTSTDIYFYNFGTGEVYPLATGESGDVATKWDERNFWIFNRASGRTSYSYLSPKQGAASRSVERKTPASPAYDPFDWLATSSGESILTLNISGQVIIADLVNGALLDSKLTSVDTGSSDIPFRPSIIIENSGEIAIFHQALDQQYQANGLGRVFFARKNSDGLWEWQDQDSNTSGIQGAALGLSNPTSKIDCTSDSCTIGGTCYQTMGSECKSGIDRLNWQSHSIEHIYDIPNNQQFAGGFSKGISKNHVLICLKASNSSTAAINQIDLTTDIISHTWNTNSEYCSTIRTDRAGQRIFTLKTSSHIRTSIISLNDQLIEQQEMSTPYSLSGIDLINE